MASTTSTNFSIDDELLNEMKNPDQARVQETREKYFEIIEKLKKLGDEKADGVCAVDELQDCIAKVNQVFEKVKTTDEIRMDAQVVHQLSSLGKANILKVQANILTFDSSEYADNLMKFVDNGESLTDIFKPESDTLRRLSESMGYLYRSTYGLEPMYGALDWVPPERLPRESQPKESRNLVAKKSIEKVVDSTTNEENQSEEVMRIFRVLKERYAEEGYRPISLMEFVIDPTSFPATVQNIFHASFLVRDGYIETTDDEFKIPCIAPVSKHIRESRINSGQANGKQGVIMMNMDIWEELIEAIGITEPMIPNLNNESKRKH